MAQPVARFGPFEVVSRIGFGGMGEVFRARFAGRRGSPEVALKLIRPEHASDPRFRQMFLAEARVGALLDHPNIAGMVDFGEVDGVLYLASELVDGLSLHRLLSSGPLPLEVGAWVVGALLDALDYAHELRDAAGKPLGLVHRDVSPANVLLSRTGSVKLADFGVSKVAGAPLTLTGELKGKPAFMAPEQLPGHGMVDRRADVFAAGVVLHLVALGRAPFTDVQRWLMDGTPLDARGRLEDLITLSLAPDPAHRFASAGEFAAALRRALPVSSDAAAELGRRVRELAAGERPLTDMERLIMAQLEPSGLIYAPDPSTGRLFVVASAGRTPTPALAFDESGPTDTKAFDVPEMTPTVEFETRTTVVDSGPQLATPPPELGSLTPTPTPLSMPSSLGTPTPVSMPTPLSMPTPPPPPMQPPPSLRMPTPLPRVIADSQPTPTPTPLMALGSNPLTLDPVPSRRRIFPVVALVTVLVAASVVVVVMAAMSREMRPRPLEAPTSPSPPTAIAPAPSPTPTPTPSPKLPEPADTRPAAPEPAKTPPPTPEPARPTPPEATKSVAPAAAARPKPRPPRPPDAPIGYLTLDTDPWSVVYLGTHELGTTPFMRVAIPSGRQQLIFDVQGSGRRVRRAVDIPPNAVKRLALQLR